MNDSNLKYEWDESERLPIRLENFLYEVDEDFVPSLSSRVNLKEYSHKLSLNASNLFVTLDGIDVASCSLYCNTSIGYVSSVAVKSEYRRMDIGYKMMQEVFRYAIENKCKSIQLEVGVNNISAIAFYESLRFMRKDKNADSFLMEKEL